MKITIIVLILMFLSGCIFPYPHYNWRTPKYVGVVYDKETGKPIEGAEIRIKGSEQVISRSGKDGEYELGPDKEFEFLGVLCPGPCDSIPEDYVLVATFGQKKSEIQKYSCVGHPSFQCNGQEEKVDFYLE